MTTIPTTLDEYEALSTNDQFKVWKFMTEEGHWVTPPSSVLWYIFKHRSGTCGMCNAPRSFTMTKFWHGEARRHAWVAFLFGVASGLIFLCVFGTIIVSGLQ